MMLFVWLTVGLLVILAAAVCRYYRSPNPERETLSAVSRQHIDLYNGGQLDEAELDNARKRYTQWLHEEQFEPHRSQPGARHVLCRPCPGLGRAGN